MIQFPKEETLDQPAVHSGGVSRGRFVAVAVACWLLVVCISMALQWYFNGPLTAFQLHFNGTYTALQWHFNGTSTGLQWHFNSNFFLVMWILSALVKRLSVSRMHYFSLREPPPGSFYFHHLPETQCCNCTLFEYSGTMRFSFNNQFL